MLYPGPGLISFETSPFSLVMSQEWLLEAAHYSNITPTPRHHYTHADAIFRVLSVLHRARPGHCSSIAMSHHT